MNYFRLLEKRLTRVSSGFMKLIISLKFVEKLNDQIREIHLK